MCVNKELALYENGSCIGEVRDLNFNEGKTEVVNFPTIGGETYHIPGFQNIPTVTFQCKSSPNTSKTHYLRKDDVTIPIKITRVQGSGGDGWLTIHTICISKESI